MTAPGPALSRAGFLLVTTGGLGLLRPASGTWGSLPPCVLAGAFIWFRGAPEPNTLNWVLYHAMLVGVLVLFSGACVVFGPAAETRFGRKDPSPVVADETAGQVLPLMLLPISAFTPASHLVTTLALAFVLFRVCDIIKPWPARGLQRLPAGWGILIDDLVAGLQAAILTQLIVRYLLF